MASGIGKKGWRKGKVWTAPTETGKRTYQETKFHPRDRLFQYGFINDNDHMHQPSNFYYKHPDMGFKITMHLGSSQSFRLEYPDGRLVLEEQTDDPYDLGAEERFVDRVEEFMAPLRP